jgi:tetratricopeptide (TPR) repeat protein
LIFAVVFPLLVHQPYQQTQVSKETMRNLVGEHGKLKIKQLKSYQEACETREPSHDYSYNVENGGVKGLLYPRQCGKEYDNNALEYKFIDTHGSEKCMGTARISLTEKETEVETLWEIKKDASSDTNCSTKGKTYRIRAIDSNVQSKQRKYEKMLTNYNRDIKIKPNSANAYYNRGLVYYNLGKYEKALADYNQAIQLKPYLSWAYHNRAVVYHTQGKLEKALADYNQAIFINPKYADTYSGRGLVYHTQGKLEKALADYNQAIFINPKYTDAYYNRGNVYYEQGKYKKAITDYNRALRLNPKFANAYYNRGLTYMAQGNIKKGMSDFEKAGDL